MSLRFEQLTAKQQRGSKPRCHLLTHGPATDIAARLTSLIEPWGVVRPNDRWMPAGFQHCREAQLHSASELLPLAKDRAALRSWWLAISGKSATTPNIDIASTCLVQAQEGLLLIEAKAHEVELRKEEIGKPLKKGHSEDTQRNHEQIGASIRAANVSLARQTMLAWSLSRDSRYQMSNRFAWSWKVTELGKPVILVYLAFTDCEEMRDEGLPIAGAQEWERLVKAHSEPLFPGEVWEREWLINDRLFIPLIRTAEQPLCDPT